MRTPTNKTGKSSKSTPRKATKANNRNSPISIQDIFQTARLSNCDKNDIRIREYSIRTEPTNEKSPVIKKKYIPLDIPSSIYKVLQALEKSNNGLKETISLMERICSYITISA